MNDVTRVITNLLYPVEAICSLNIMLGKFVANRCPSASRESVSGQLHGVSMGRKGRSGKVRQLGTPLILCRFKYLWTISYSSTFKSFSFGFCKSFEDWESFQRLPHRLFSFAAVAVC